MAISVSTGFKFNILGGSASFAGMFTNSVILLYGGVRPDRADYAPNDTALAQITRLGLLFTFGSAAGGLNWQLSTAGYLTGSTPDWVITAQLAGVMTWGRLCTNADNLNASTSLGRIDFDVNNIDGYGLAMSNPTMTAGEQRAMGFSLYGIPPL